MRTTPITLGAARLWVALLGAALAAGGLASCVPYQRGALVQMNISRDALPPHTDAHYALFAVADGRAIEVARFKVLDSIDDCLADPQLTSSVGLIQRYDGPGETISEWCADERRLGVLDTVNLATSQLVGGVRIDTPIDLSGADRLLLTAVPDTLPFSGPGEAVLVADLGPGVAPFDEACTDPLPAAARGVHRGVWVRAPDEVPCVGNVGRVAVVPAEDETIL